MLFVSSISPTSAQTPAPSKPLPRRRPLIIDTLGSINNPNLPEGAEDGPGKGIDARALADARAAGLCAFNQTMGYWSGKEEPFELSVRDVAAWDALIRSKPEALIKVLAAKDIRRAQAERKVGVIYGFQNAAMMGSDAQRVAIFANLGVRVIQLTYNIRNQIGDGAMVVENQGLTPLGREVVQELNKHRVLVDLSHSGEATCLDALATSKQPIIISHSGCRAVADLPRNKSDAELRLLADKGGFVGIYFMPFLAVGRQPTAADLIAHIEHAIKICGEDHVGIGTDGTVSQMDDMPAYMERLKKDVERRRAAGIGAAGERADIVTFLPDLNGPSKFMRLADLLAKRGHKSARIEKILGVNFLRVAERVWGA
ncbi:MAG: membrane dipeptidase [Betaproteobacteria bacterium]|nr:membrane dipeptidase [Betaproteobacteria bacterium]